MNNTTLTAFAAFLLLISTTLTAANHVFTGYFVDEQRTVAVEMEYLEGAYSGIMTDGADIFYELIARLDGTRLVGRVIADGQPVPFTAENHGSFLVYTIDSVGYRFYRFEPDTSAAAQPGRQQAQASKPQASSAAEQIARSRLYWNQKRSIIASSGGAYGEIDFCSNGNFWDSSESSVNVQVKDYTGDTLASAVRQRLPTMFCAI